MTLNKKLISFVMAFAVMLAMTPAIAFTADAHAAGEVTTADELNAAITNANSATTITLKDNITDNITIPVDKTITLDLNGHTLTGDNTKVTTAHKGMNSSSDMTITSTIVNKGTLTVKDTQSGGTVKSCGQYNNALFNNTGATATLDGGTFEDFDASSTNWYIVVNIGTMTINSGTTIKFQHPENNSDTALINGVDHQINGVGSVTSYQKDTVPTANTDGSTTYLSQDAVMTINGGEFNGSHFVVKNGDWFGKLTINDGGFTTNNKAGQKQGCCVSASNNCPTTINGGRFVSYSDTPVVKVKNKTAYAGHSSADGITITGGDFRQLVGNDVLETLAKTTAPDPIITVTGGNFVGTYNNHSEAGTGSSYSVNANKLSLHGGTFSADPTSYVPSGYQITTNSGSPVTYTVSAVPAPAPASNTNTSTTTTGTTTTVDTTTNGTATVSGDTATVTVAADDAAKMVSDTIAAEKTAAAAGNTVESNITITAPTAANAATDVNVTLPAATVDKIASDTNATLTIKTSVGEVTLDQKTLDAVAKDSTSGDITLNINKVDNSKLSSELQSDLGDNATVYEVTLTNSKGKITELGGTAVMLFAIPDGNDTPKCVYRDDNGNYVLMPSEVVTINGKRYLKVTTTHFSCYAVVTAAAAKKDVDKTAAKKLAASKVKNLKAAAKKGSVTLKWTKASGLKYKVYKMSGSKYKCIKTVSTNTYKDTKVKAGKTYKYKVRGYKKISGKTVYTKYASVSVKAK